MQRNCTSGASRYIEYILYNSGRIREALHDARDIARQSHDISMISSSGAISDTTADDAIRNITDINHIRIDGDVISRPGLWLQLVDIVQRYCVSCGDTISQIYSRRYSGEDYRKTCRDIHISAQQYSVGIRKIRNYALCVACQLQLVSVI